MHNIIIKGAPGSPYTRKMLSIMRYRRIPYEYVITGLDNKGIMNKKSLPNAKVNLLPTFYFSDENDNLEPMIDSTFILRRLEKMISFRSIIPNNTVAKFLNYLLEDYADEWLTKSTFHYRWSYKNDIEKAGSTLSRWTSLTKTDNEIKEIKNQIQNRQISRLKVVGSNSITAEIIENSYKRFLKLIASHMNNFPFIFGKRPSSSDFAIFGQLSQLVAFDPTPMEIADKIAPRIVAWTGIMEDLSGLDISVNDWRFDPENSQTLKNIFSEIGEVYIPLLLANADAIKNKKKIVNVVINNKNWTQEPFSYQLKCLNWIKEEYYNLDINSKKVLDSFLEETGCESILR